MTALLDQLASWPVANCAAAVVGPAGVLATAGPVSMRFPLASVTKPLTALAVLVAVEEGALELDQPIAEPIGGIRLIQPKLAEQLPAATLGHLLAHASGLAPDRWRRAAAVGTRRIYSNTGFVLIGQLVAAATEIPFADYLAEAVFQPLRMTTAELAGSPARDGIASVADLCALLGELLNPSGLLHPDSLQAATSVQFPGLPGVLPGYGGQRDNAWGYGFEIRDGKRPHWTSVRNSPATYGHFGQSGTVFWVDPVARLGLVALADRPFGDWAIQAWPPLADAVLDSFG
ncbi:MAG TPA: serine hydrolase domain-containing protein [Jatrophihabitans sp.]|nr:serine hydrolase domain-containing protein [Jatrophihabitans sp.]